MADADADAARPARAARRNTSSSLHPPPPQQQQSLVVAWITWLVAAWIACVSWLLPFSPIHSWLNSTPPSSQDSSAKMDGASAQSDIRTHPNFDDDDIFSSAATSMVRRRHSHRPQRPSRQSAGGLSGGDSTNESDCSSSTALRRRLVRRRISSPTMHSQQRPDSPNTTPPRRRGSLLSFFTLSTSDTTRIPPRIREPSSLKQKTLILDLDETLIHSTSTGSRHHDHVIEVLVDRHVCLYYVYKRPHVDHFLKKVSQWYKVVIFTASMPEYADPVIDWLDTDRALISRRYFRQSCIATTTNIAPVMSKLGGASSPAASKLVASAIGPVQVGYIKNLALVESDLANVVLIDNSPVSYALNQDNAIPIETWTSDPRDEALMDLIPFLDALRFCEDVRSVLSLRL